MHLATEHGPCICSFDNLGTLGNLQNPYDIVPSKHSMVWDAVLVWNQLYHKSSWIMLRLEHLLDCTDQALREIKMARKGAEVPQPYL